VTRQGGRVILSWLLANVRLNQMLAREERLRREICCRFFIISWQLASVRAGFK